MRISYANVVATMALVFAVGGTAFAASNSGSSATLKLCAAKKNGDLRLLSSSGGACRSGERAVVVDRHGTPGAAGPAGRPAWPAHRVRKACKVPRASVVPRASAARPGPARSCPAPTGASASPPPTAGSS